MADFSDIPDEAWIDVVAAVGWDESNELWPVLQTAVAAALPVLNTARDAETADEFTIRAAELDRWLKIGDEVGFHSVADLMNAMRHRRDDFRAASLRGEQ